MSTLVELIKFTIQLITHKKTLVLGLIISLLLALVYNFISGIQEATTMRGVVFDTNRVNWLENFIIRAIPVIMLATVPLVVGGFFVTVFLLIVLYGLYEKKIRAKRKLISKIFYAVILLAWPAWAYWLGLPGILLVLIGFSFIFFIIWIFTRAEHFLTPSLLDGYDFERRENAVKAIALGCAFIAAAPLALHLARVEGFREGTRIVCSSPQITQKEHLIGMNPGERSFLLYRTKEEYVTFTQTFSKTISPIPGLQANSVLIGRGCSVAGTTIVPAADAGTVTLVYDKQVQPGECCYQLFRPTPTPIPAPTPSATPDP